MKNRSNLNDSVRIKRPSLTALEDALLPLLSYSDKLSDGIRMLEGEMDSGNDRPEEYCAQHREDEFRETMFRLM